MQNGTLTFLYQTLSVPVLYSQISKQSKKTKMLFNTKLLLRKQRMSCVVSVVVQLKPRKLGRQARVSYVGRVYYPGSVKDVLNRGNCPLCLLVVYALSRQERDLRMDYERGDINDDELAQKVKIRWDGDVSFTIDRFLNPRTRLILVLADLLAYGRARSASFLIIPW